MESAQILLMLNTVKCHPRPLLSPEPSPQPLTHRLPAQDSGAGFWQRPHAQTTLERYCSEYK